VALLGVVVSFLGEVAKHVLAFPYLEVEVSSLVVVPFQEEDLSSWVVRQEEVV
jgi:hypothetical protein